MSAGTSGNDQFRERTVPEPFPYGFQYCQGRLPDPVTVILFAGYAMSGNSGKIWCRPDFSRARGIIHQGVAVFGGVPHSNWRAKKPVRSVKKRENPRNENLPVSSRKKKKNGICRYCSTAASAVLISAVRLVPANAPEVGSAMVKYGVTSYWTVLLAGTVMSRICPPRVWSLARKWRW